MQVLKIRHLPRLPVKGEISLFLQGGKGKDGTADLALGPDYLTFSGGVPEGPGGGPQTPDSLDTVSNDRAPRVPLNSGLE